MKKQIDYIEIMNDFRAEKKSAISIVSHFTAKDWVKAIEAEKPHDKMWYMFYQQTMLLYYNGAMTYEEMKDFFDMYEFLKS